MASVWFVSLLGATELPFNDDWYFRRGEGTFATPTWRAVETPHDWAIENLPSRAEDHAQPVLAVRSGNWRFSPGEGDASWADPAFDDTSWKTVVVPGDWRSYGYTATNATGWFRLTFPVSPAQLAAAEAGALRLALGDVANADVTYVNGVQVGATGSMREVHDQCSARLAYRRYAVSAAVLRPANNTLAVHVWSPGGSAHPGGLFDWDMEDTRAGPFDPGASPGTPHAPTGYTLGGVGLYRKTFPTPAEVLSGETRAALLIEGCYMNCSFWCVATLFPQTA
jgi:hypothetical protein